MKKLLNIIREIALEKVTITQNEAIEHSKQHHDDLAMYGQHYKNTIGYDMTELRIKWLELKVNILIHVFRLK